MFAWQVLLPTEPFPQPCSFILAAEWSWLVKEESKTQGNEGNCRCSLELCLHRVKKNPFTVQNSWDQHWVLLAGPGTHTAGHIPNHYMPPNEGRMPSKILASLSYHLHHDFDLLSCVLFFFFFRQSWEEATLRGRFNSPMIHEGKGSPYPQEYTTALIHKNLQCTPTVLLSFPLAQPTAFSLGYMLCFDNKLLWLSMLLSWTLSGPGRKDFTQFCWNLKFNFIGIKGNLDRTTFSLEQ